MTPPVTTDALDAAATKALSEELFTYANQLVRVETQAGLGGKDLSVRVKEPGWLADLMRRSASALQARRLAAAEASLATANAELARLRAEGEAKDRALKLLLPFVDYAAGEGLMFLGSDDTERPEMDAADICFGVAEALGMELGDPEFLALVEEGQAAIAARAATASEGQADA